MMPLAAVAVGGAIGASCRYGIGLAASRWLGAAFPFGTLLVNVLGCLLMGLFAAVMAKHSSAAHEWQLFIAVGVLGGFTTFSSFALEAFTLAQRGEVGLALLYVGASVLLSLAALALGFMLARGA